MKNADSTNYKDWITKGRHDFEDAKRLLESGGYADTICFLCQQAVEKYLKGYLVFKKTKPRAIHKLEDLANDCAKLDKSFSTIADECLFLSGYYIETRYPPLMPIEYPKKEALKAVETTEGILKFIVNRLKK